MSTSTKRAYYRGAGMAAQLARRYYALLGPAARILDLGCGIGSFGSHRPPGVEVYGLDADELAVREASWHEHAQVFDLESGPLPFADATFDAVLAKDVIEHVLDAGSLVREIHRVVRPGGCVVASVVMAIPRRVWADYTHVRGFTHRSARLVFEDAGFSVEDVWPMGGVPLSTRLHLLDLVPTILRFPPAGWLWSSSWELKARR